MKNHKLVSDRIDKVYWINIYRANIKKTKVSYIQRYFNNIKELRLMVLDVLLNIKITQDPTLSFRRSCREGICGSCAMNINGKNQLACLASLNDFFKVEMHNRLKKYLTIFPLPSLFVIKDLVTDLTLFFIQYKQIKPWLIGKRNKMVGVKSYLQGKAHRKKLDGLYECILCACCSTTCPSYWWHNVEYLGPAILLQSFRWIVDSRDLEYKKRLNFLKNTFAVYKCHQILNCSKVCPKSLNPGAVIKELKKKIYNVLITE